jgi:hypothetical protein
VNLNNHKHDYGQRKEVIFNREKLECAESKELIFNILNLD